MNRMAAQTERRAGTNRTAFRRLTLYLKQRGWRDSHQSPPRGGTAGPAAKDPPSPKPGAKTVREQYGISAMIYGLVVLLGGIYCAMTDAGRLASERGFAIDAALWAPWSPQSGKAPSLQTFEAAALTVPTVGGPTYRRPLEKLAPAATGTELPEFARQRREARPLLRKDRCLPEIFGPVPSTQALERVVPARYALARDGA